MCGRKYMHLTEITAGFFLFLFLFFFFFFCFAIHFIKEKKGVGGGDLERFRSLRIINTIPSVSFNKLD